MTLAELHAADPAMHAVLLESCAGHVTLAGMLVARIAGLAAEAATTAERERVVAHLQLGRIAGLDVAAAAIADGSSVIDHQVEYMAAAAAVRSAPVLQLVPQKAKEESK